jgi:CheY-like chemotaxis protein
MRSSILLIEDEAALQRLISWFLLEEGHEVAVAANAGAALTRLAEYAPDVIVFNTAMEDAAKGAAMEKMRALAPSARILDVSEEKNARARGMIAVSVDGKYADASLDIPFPKERLLEAIAKLRSGEEAAPASASPGLAAAD